MKLFPTDTLSLDMYLKQIVSMCGRRGLILTAFLVFSIILLVPTFHEPTRTNVKETMHQTVSTVQSLVQKDNIMDIYNSTLGFEKLLVLSLPGRVDKRDAWALASVTSDIDLTWVPGVRGEDIPPKARPAAWDPNESNATLGCARGHMNAMQKIVEERISSALVFEDDADWDIMLKSQLVEFAHGARYLQKIQNSKGLHSPYGDDWDVLWIGYCGARSRSNEDQRYFISYDDPTVVPEVFRQEKRQGRFFDDSNPVFGGNYTRVVFEPVDLRCLFAYAVSLRGAEKFLYNFSILPRATTADRAMSGFCSSRLSDAFCISPFPQLVDTYRAAGDTSKDSDRRPIGRPVFRKKGESPNIAFPVKSGLESFISGEQFYISNYPNDTLVPEINPQTYQLPQGMGVELSPEEFSNLEY